VQLPISSFYFKILNGVNNLDRADYNLEGIAPNKALLVEWLSSKEEAKIKELFDWAYRVKAHNIGEKVFLRGLIEISNICSKNCYYCGIRGGNPLVERYELTEDQVVAGALFAYKSGYGSIVLQGGERSNSSFTKKITALVKKIKEVSGGKLGVTLSLGEQSRDTFLEWYEAGAHRYLLRIESSNPDIFRKIHPVDSKHDWESRVNSLLDLQEIGYQTGTGVMIGLPFQSEEDLAEDLLFMRNFGVDMVGMGPYLSHSQTPMAKWNHRQPPLSLTLKMVALLRLLMPKINIAATTAMQVVESRGREMAIKAGANIIMPNMTLTQMRDKYLLYDNKPGVEEDAEISKSKLESNLKEMGIEIGWGEWGDSKAFFERQ